MNAINAVGEFIRNLNPNDGRTRLGVGAVLALPVAGGLFFIMQYLIATADANIDDKKSRKLADIHMPDRELKTQLDALERPDEPEEQPETEPPQLDIELNVEVTELQPGKVNVSIGKFGSMAGGEYLPIVKVAPIYPRRAQTRGVTGYCIVEYTVTRTGTTRDPRAVDCHPKGMFESASVKAALKFKYKPRVVDGEPVEVAGVQNQFTYELEQ